MPRDFPLEILYGASESAAFVRTERMNSLSGEIESFQKRTFLKSLPGILGYRTIFISSSELLEWRKTPSVRKMYPLQKRTTVSIDFF